MTQLSNLKQMWIAIDLPMNIYPNSLADANVIEDEYFSPIMELIKANDSVPIERQTAFTKPKTVSTRFTAFRYFLSFSISRQVFLGIKAEDEQLLQKRMKEMDQTMK